jgi:pimeloyl-ACP methyl ester carboxylesterase
VTPGSSGRLFLHDIGAPSRARAERLRLAQQSGAWTYVQRGHAPSDRIAGGVYRISEFTLDLLRLLRHVLPAPVLIRAEGAGGLVAALAAAAEPERVRGLSLLHGEGWGSRPRWLVSEESEANASWLPAIQERRTVRGLEDDPMLRHGPPETMPAEAVGDALSHSAVPWWAPSGHFLERFLPAESRSPADLVGEPGPD